MWAGLQSSPDLESYFTPRRNLGPEKINANRTGHRRILELARHTGPARFNLKQSRSRNQYIPYAATRAASIAAPGSCVK
jgi:hypothetical protein